MEEWSTKCWHNKHDAQASGVLNLERNSATRWRVVLVDCIDHERFTYKVAGRFLSMRPTRVECCAGENEFASATVRQQMTAWLQSVSDWFATIKHNAVFPFVQSDHARCGVGNNVKAERPKCLLEF